MPLHTLHAQQFEGLICLFCCWARHECRAPRTSTFLSPRRGAQHHSQSIGWNGGSDYLTQVVCTSYAAVVIYSRWPHLRRGCVSLSSVCKILASDPSAKGQRKYNSIQIISSSTSRESSDASVVFDINNTESLSPGSIQDQHQCAACCLGSPRAKH